MRDCIFLLADSNMRAAFEGFFSRDRFHLTLGCGAFSFDSRRDIAVAAADNDPGLYTRGHELLRPYKKSHHRAVVVLDAAWEGSPGAEAIRRQLSDRIQSVGWDLETFRVIVIDPELENWIWQVNDHVARGLGFADGASLVADPVVCAAWLHGQAKPLHPKEVLEAVLRKQRIPRSSAIYRNITGKVSIKGCRDGAFHELLEALRTWFPSEEDHA